MAGPRLHGTVSSHNLVPTNIELNEQTWNKVGLRTNVEQIRNAQLQEGTKSE